MDVAEGPAGNRGAADVDHAVKVKQGDIVGLSEGARAAPGQVCGCGRADCGCGLGHPDAPVWRPSGSSLLSCPLARSVARTPRRASV